jgi:hypothetical protein
MIFLRTCAFVVAAFVLWHACVSNDVPEIESRENLTINLRWVKSYPTESQDDIVKGLKWVFSFLGAALPKGSMEDGLTWHGDGQVTVNISVLGFNKSAELAWTRLFDILKQSEEYQKFGGIDIGRFVMLTLNSSNHYYAITGANQTYNQFRSRYLFDGMMAGVVVSGIARNNRIIELSIAKENSEIAFVAYEGEGSVADKTFTAQELEVISIMQNGQLLFALYDLDGHLKTSASSSLTLAGKPAKCLWCHELGLGVPIFDNSNLTGYYSTEQFSDEVAKRMDIIRAHRKTLGSDLDFSLTQEHTKAELLYLAFMEPSLERLASEWKITLQEAQAKLEGFATHPHHEFAFLGDALYRRNEIEILSSFEGMPFPTEAREPSPFEPDLIH